MAGGGGRERPGWAFRSDRPMRLGGGSVGTVGAYGDWLRVELTREAYPTMRALGSAEQAHVMLCADAMGAWPGSPVAPHG
jgi:hypothetical protein